MDSLGCPASYTAAKEFLDACLEVSATLEKSDKCETCCNAAREIVLMRWLSVVVTSDEPYTRAVVEMAESMENWGNAAALIVMEHEMPRDEFILECTGKAMTRLFFGKVLASVTERGLI